MELVNLNDQGSIKAYFLKIKELHAGGEQYPVDLDDIWPLCYSQKAKAVTSLVEKHLENIDYEVFSQNGKNPTGGRPIKVYKLSTSCFEHFIARKIKEVFEVYRQVFHLATAQQPQLSEIDILLKSVQILKQQEVRISAVEDKVQRLEAKHDTSPDYFTVMGYSALNNKHVGLQTAAKIGAKAKAICRNKGFTVEKMPDPRFGRVNLYPIFVLKQVFDDIVN